MVGESDAIAFAVDSNDAMRMPVAGVELGRVIFRAEASGTSVLVLATKQDLAGAVPPGIWEPPWGWRRVQHRW